MRGKKRQMSRERESFSGKLFNERRAIIANLLIIKLTTLFQKNSLVFDSRREPCNNN